MNEICQHKSFSFFNSFQMKFRTCLFFDTFDIYTEDMRQKDNQKNIKGRCEDAIKYVFLLTTYTKYEMFLF